MRDTLDQLRFVEPPHAILCRNDVAPALTHRQHRKLATDSVRQHRVSIVRGSAVDPAASGLLDEEGWLDVAQGAPTRTTASRIEGIADLAGRSDAQAEPTSWLPRQYYSSPSGARCERRCSVAIYTSGSNGSACACCLVLRTPIAWSLA